jgi:hypothetical protein
MCRTPVERTQQIFLPSLPPCLSITPPRSPVASSAPGSFDDMNAMLPTQQPELISGQ